MAPFYDNIVIYDPTIEIAIMDIVLHGLTEQRFCRLHQSMYHDYDGMAGIYRTLPVLVNWLSLPLSHQVSSLVWRAFTDIDISTLTWSVEWFITILEHIHPFMDGNGRTCMLALESHLIHLGYAPFYFGENRDIWESITYTKTLQDYTWRVEQFIKNLNQIIDRKW
jgi:fido (protein-threonine AMPylation protein)